MQKGTDLFQLQELAVRMIQRRLQKYTIVVCTLIYILLHSSLSFTPSHLSSSSSSSSYSSSSHISSTTSTSYTSLPILLPVSGSLVSGSSYANTPWHFLEKFCFDEAGGFVQFTLIEDPGYVASLDPAIPSNQQIAFYADQEEVWGATYGNNSLSCNQKVGNAKAAYPIRQLVLTNNTWGYSVVGIIPRWWFITVSNCAPLDGLGRELRPDGTIEIIFYEIHFTNKAGIYQYEFSKDVQGILEMSIFFLCLYWILMFVLAWIKQHAKEKNLQYTVVKEVFISMLIEWFALMLNLIHYAKFAHDGEGIIGCSYAYYFFDFISVLILLYTVLKICMGWAISTNYIPWKRILILILFLLWIFYITLFIWQQYIMDPASVLYVYETIPGWTIVSIRGALTIVAAVFLVQTYQIEQEHTKKQFYLVWSFFSLIWLMSLPWVVGIAHLTESWKRQRVVFALTNSIQAAMYIILTYLFRPFRSNRYVDILKPDETRAFGTNNMQIFPSAPVEFTTI